MNDDSTCPQCKAQIGKEGDWYVDQWNDTDKDQCYKDQVICPHCGCHFLNIYKFDRQEILT